MTATIESRVKQICVDHLGVSGDKVIPEASFEDNLGADSLDRVELVMGFEEEFDIEIDDADAEKLTTVGEAIEYLRKRV